MRIGIVVYFQHSFFSTGCNQTALAIAEVLRQQGHSIFFVNSGPAAGWWEDCKSLSENWQVMSKGCVEAQGADVLIELDRFLLTRTDRAALAAKKGVLFIRKNPIMADIEAALYPITPGERNLDGISEIWVFKEFSTKDDIEYLETLTNKKILQLPYVWTPTGVEFHRRESQAPLWFQVAELPEMREKSWSLHICETNTSNTSSCTIPLFLCRDIKRSTGVAIDRQIKVHNAEHIAKSEFFRFNVLKQVFSDIPDCSGVFVGRQRIIDFVFDPKSCILAHSRFLPLRAYLLDALWVGIPLVHNSPYLRDLGGEAATGFYPDNEILAGRGAFERVVVEKSDLANASGRLADTRRRILETCSPYSPKIQEAYSQVLKESVEEPKEKVLKVGFCDMWDGFNAEYNPFTLLLEAAGVLVKGQTADSSVDLVIFGPFGTDWQTLPQTIPKVHYTGENTPCVLREDIKLNLGFAHKDTVDEGYLRLPLWMLEINWFQADVERLGNPKPLPINRVCKVYEEELERKKKFCAFIVTNPRQPMRNAAFHWLSEYKWVDSAGRLFNNIGDKIFAGLGGGGGELKKLEFLKDYRFCLAYENESSPGYCTEKYLHAKAAGCVPIYWGDPKAERDFDMAGCVDARAITNAKDLQDAVKQLEENPALWKKAWSVPALDEVHRDLVRRTLAECARRMLRIVGWEAAAAAVPRFIGATEDHEPEPKNSSVETQHISFDNTVFVTACDSKFLSSLTIWLRSASAQKTSIPELGVLVYLMADVSEDVKESFAKDFPFAQFHRFPTETPEGFPDFWASEHFGWKLWLYNKLSTDEGLKGRPILYTDAGVLMCRWPREWMTDVKNHGISMLEDEQQISAHWCHKESQEIMKMTEAELKSHQVIGGICCFIAGSPSAKRLFKEAYEWAQNRKVLTGPKWAGLAADGKQYGHRHDQSILSVLSHRMKIHRYPLYKVYCDISMRQTYMKQMSFYVHRGQFSIHKPFLPKIDDVWVINLDRRPDRLESFYKAHPELKTRSLRLPAFDGRKLQLTDRLARLFAPHDFNWKKSVMGCALSHLAVWTQLLNDKEEINSYLICEDDARLKPGWKEAWTKASSKLPEEWDLVYLGGILPPNRDAFDAVGIEQVAEGIGKVARNTIFGQQEPTRYMHFCAYAYVLTKRGALKILEVLKARGGYWTSADHMMCNIHELLNIYFVNPLVAGCFQDEDPIYCQSAFNDFSRKDSFDSDLWNNTESFSQEEVRAKLDVHAPLDILGALEDARKGETSITIGKEEPAEAKKELGKVLQETKASQIRGARRIVSIGKKENLGDWYEGSWLTDILFHNAGICLDTHVWAPGDADPTDEPIVLINRESMSRTLPVLEGWNARGVRFYVLHLSDEFCKDPVFWYDWPCVQGVLRNYGREDVPDSDKVRTIPLGWHWALSRADPRENTPRPPFREFAWSFVGTDWMGRGEKLEVLKGVPGEHKCVFMKEWNSPESLSREETLGILLNSWFVPCPGGQNAETFRIYEALEAGAIPVFVKDESMEPLIGQLARRLPLLVAENWGQAAAIIHTLKNGQPEQYDMIRGQVLNAWVAWKEDIRATVRNIYKV